MTKKELVEFLKEEFDRIEDILYSLGEIDTIDVDDPEMLDYHIRVRFSDALMLLNAGKIDELKVLLENASNQKWL